MECRLAIITVTSTRAVGPVYPSSSLVVSRDYIVLASEKVIDSQTVDLLSFVALDQANLAIYSLPFLNLLLLGIYTSQCRSQMPTPQARNKRGKAVVSNRLAFDFHYSAHTVSHDIRYCPRPMTRLDISIYHICSS